MSKICRINPNLWVWSLSNTAALAMIALFSPLAAALPVTPLPVTPLPVTPLPARSPLPMTPTPQTETLLSFQTRQYAVRLFRQQGILRLNLYNRQTDTVELRGMPMQQAVTNTGIVYTNLQGQDTYSVIVAPDGSAYWLKIQQGDRLTYNERVQHPQASEKP
jgi:hypothetical protein